MSYILTSRTPKLDLHGEKTDIVYALVKEFLEDNLLLKNQVLRIVHGKSTNILTKEVHNVLNEFKKVKEFKLNPWNLGETIVILDL